MVRKPFELRDGIVSEKEQKILEFGLLRMNLQLEKSEANYSG